MGPIDTYNRSLDAAVETLLANQRGDGGWGLSLTSVSSIVNTAEALTVLRAAGFDGSEVARAVQYLSLSIPRHCQPLSLSTTGVKGRGERSRFVSFGLDGLLLFPWHLDSAAVETINWCLGWYEKNQLERGWPEESGAASPSIHQSALAIVALCKLSMTAHATTHKAALLHLAPRAAKLAAEGTEMLLQYRREAGFWPASLGQRSSPSFSITALANTALGYFAHLKDLSDHGDLRRETAKWLTANYRTWKTLVEHDPHVEGTTWLHLAYAECIRGVLAGSDGGGVASLSGSWRFLNKGWSMDQMMWTEATGHGSPATIRAAYHTVMAFESAKPESTLLLPRELSSSDVDGLPTKLHPAPIDYRLIIVNGGYTLASADGNRIPRVVMPPEAQNILRIIVSAKRPMAATELAEITGKKPNSVTKNISVVNNRFMQASHGAVVKLIKPKRIIESETTYYGYCLSVPLDARKAE